LCIVVPNDYLLQHNYTEIALDRNVLTPADVVAIRDANATKIARGVSGPPSRVDAAGDRMMGGEAVDAAYPGGFKAPSPDSWNQRLLKYIPGEAMGTYLALDRAANTSDALRKNALVLGLVLLASMVFNSVYLRRVWKVRRLSQIVTSNIALVAYGGHPSS
jgi:hypothetical protein